METEKRLSVSLPKLTGFWVNNLGGEKLDNQHQTFYCLSGIRNFNQNKIDQIQFYVIPSFCDKFKH